MCLEQAFRPQTGILKPDPPPFLWTSVAGVVQRSVDCVVLADTASQGVVDVGDKVVQRT